MFVTCLRTENQKCLCLKIFTYKIWVFSSYNIKISISLHDIATQEYLSQDIHFYTYPFEIQCNNKKLLLTPTQIRFEFFPYALCCWPNRTIAV